MKLKYRGKKVSFNDPLGAVAFFMDTEHKVTPITEGVRSVLKYDVDLVPGGVVEIEDSDESSTTPATKLKIMGRMRSPRIELP